MRGRTIALAGLATAVIACGAALLASILAGPAAGPRAADNREAGYIQALDTAMGWPAPGPQQRANDLTVAGQICTMLSQDWNEAGIVANMLTWPGNRLTQGQLATAVHITRLDFCGQDT